MSRKLPCQTEHCSLPTVRLQTQSLSRYLLALKVGTSGKLHTDLCRVFPEPKVKQILP